MSGSSITLAVEIHRNETLPEPDDFKAYLIPLKQSPNYRISNGAATCSAASPTNENVENLFDNDKSTQWTGYFESTIEIEYAFSNRRREWFNTYSLTSASSQPERDPLSWRLEGSEDGLAWDRLDYQSNVIFAKRGQTLSFNLASNRRSYNKVRLTIMAVRGSTEQVAQLAELRLLATENEVLDQNLHYSSNEFTYIVGITEGFSVKPMSSGYQSYSILPELPAGVSIDANSGEIAGATDTANAERIVYSVTAMSSVTGTNSTATVSIFFTSCSGPNNARLDFVKYNQPGSDRESWTLSCPSNSTVIEGAGVDGTDIQVYHACVNREVCTLTLKDSLGDAWVKGAYLSVTMFNGDHAYPLGKALVADSDVTVIKLNTDFLVNEGSDDIKVYNGAEYRENWFSDAGFTSTFVPVNTNVVLPRRHWYIYTNVATPVVKNNYMAYHVYFYCRAGAVLYLNGVEKYRVNVPEGPMTAETDITGGSALPYWHVYTGMMSELSDGANAFAFEITNALSAANITVDFKMSVYLDTSSSELSLTEEAEAEASAVSGSYPVSRIIDGDWASYTLLPRSSRTDSQWIGVKFPQESRREINRYCVTCNPDFSRYDPTHWVLTGGNDASQANSWDVLDERQNVRFSKREQRLCFTTNATAAYNQYRMIMKENRNIYPTNAFAVAELELFTVYNLAEEPFAYQMTVVNGYTQQPFPTLTTNAPIGVVTVSPELPNGLTLDPYTGRISGRPLVPNTSGNHVYTLTNTRGTQQDTTTIDITIAECAAPQYLFFLHMTTTGAMGPKMNFTVADALTGNTLLNVPSMPLQEEMFWPVCGNPMHVEVRCGGKEITSWGQFYLEIMMEDQVVIGKSLLAQGEPDSFYPFYMIHPNDQWKYLYGNPNSEVWMNPSFDDSAWGFQVPGTFPELTNTAQYYRRSFNVEAVNDTTTIMYRIRVSAGSILYLNGKEIYRVNMPAGPVTPEMLASSEFLNSQSLSGTVVLSSDSLIPGTNVLAVENHRLSMTRVQNDFKATLFIADYKMYAMTEGEASADIMNSGSHGYLKAFDFLEDTTYVSGPRCEGAVLQWTYPMGSRYTVNQYFFSSQYGNCVSNFPTSWAVEGSNDGNTWSMIDYVSDVVSTTGGNRVVRSFLATQTYNVYRLRVTGCKNVVSDSSCSTGLIAGEFAMFNTKINFNEICESDLGFAAALKGGYSFGTCPKGYTGYRRRLCQNDGTFAPAENLCTPEAPSYLAYPQMTYDLTTGMEITTAIKPSFVCIACSFTSSPTLPNGLTLDAASGSITGAAHNSTSAFFYTITGRNTAGSISTALRIAVVDSGANCPADFTNGWSTTPAGTNATRACPDSINYVGSMTRMCMNVVPPVWGPVVGDCQLLPPNITYPVTNITLEKRVEMDLLVPTVFGAELNSITINPNLPAGLYFVGSRGTIAGAPTVKDLAGTEYTITVSNAAGNYSTTLNITIIALTCPAVDGWQETDIGDRAYKSCDAMMDGTNYRECLTTSPPSWGNPVNTCTYRQPVVTYPNPAVTLYRNVPMTTMTPTVQNYVSSWTVTPNLPAGLTLNSANGAISGTPTTQTAQSTYSVVASNPHTSTTVVLTITVDLLKCPNDGVWTETEHGQTATATCTDPTNMEGTRTRTCNLSGSTAQWGQETNTCKYRQPTISYRSNIVGYKGEPIAAVEPTHQYRITSYAISPALPAGLYFDTASGIISGTPTEGKDTTMYTVTASNEDTSATATISVQVIVPMCAAEGEWATIERGLTGYLFCVGTSGVRTRVCGTGKTDRNPKWNPEDTSMCLATPEKTKPSEGKAFIRVKIQYTGITTATAKAFEQESLRSTLADGLKNVGVSASQVVLQSVQDGEMTLLSAGMTAHYRIETAISNVDLVKTALETYVNQKTYETTLRTLGDSLSSVSARVDTSSYKVKKYSSMNAVVVVLLVILIVFLVIFGGLLFVYLKVRSKPTPKGGLQSLKGRQREEGFVPQGNVGTSYDSQYSPTHVSDEEEEERPRRSPRKQRYEDDDDEEEERPRRSPKKQRYEDDDEEEERPRRSPKNRKAYV